MSKTTTYWITLIFGLSVIGFAAAKEYVWAAICLSAYLITFLIYDKYK